MAFSSPWPHLLRALSPLLCSAYGDNERCQYPSISVAPHTLFFRPGFNSFFSLCTKKRAACLVRNICQQLGGRTHGSLDSHISRPTHHCASKTNGDRLKSPLIMRHGVQDSICFHSTSCVSRAIERHPFGAQLARIRSVQKTHELASSHRASTLG